MKHWVSLLALAVVSVVAGGAGAGEPGACRSETAAMLEEDADGDGQVTLLEARAAELALFEHFDRNGDGEVVRSEAEAAAGSWRGQRVEQRFAALDRDGDGTLSRPEVRLPPRRFAHADRDGDGQLTRAELARAFQRDSGTGRDTAALRSRFWRRDLNRDGRVTRSEMLAAADRRFMRRARGGGVVLSSRGR